MNSKNCDNFRLFHFSDDQKFLGLFPFLCIFCAENDFRLGQLKFKSVRFEIIRNKTYEIKEKKERKEENKRQEKIKDKNYNKKLKS